MKSLQPELSILQKVYDLTLWYVPHLNWLPRDHKFLLGDRIIASLYDIYDDLLQAKYGRDKLERLKQANMRLELLRHRTRLLRDFKLLSPERYYFVAKAVNQIGSELGGWMKQQGAYNVNSRQYPER